MLSGQSRSVGMLMPVPSSLGGLGSTCAGCDSSATVGQPIPGTSCINTGFGACVDCSIWAQWLFNTGCWKYSPTTWEQMAQYPPPPMPVTVGSPGGSTLTIPPASGPQAQQTIDQIIARQVAAQIADYTAFYGTVPDVPPDCGTDVPTLNADGSWKCPVSTLTYVMLAVGVLGVGLVAFGAGARR